MKQIIAIFLITTVLQACAIAPPATPSFSISKDSKIGVYIDTESSPHHTHIGTTIFSNFQKQYPYDWNLKAFTYERVNSQLIQAGFTPVNLDDLGYTFDELNHLVMQSDSGWLINLEAANITAKLRNDFSLRAVVVIKESPVQADLECSGGPCSSRMVEGNGLYSRSVFGMSRYKAVAAITTKVFLLDPPAQLDRNGPLSSQRDDRRIMLKDYDGAKDFDNFTETELQPVRMAIEKYITSVAQDIAITLASTQEPKNP